MKVIACTLDNKTYQYLAIDSQSGGYPYWSNHLRSAEQYSDSEEDHRRMRTELNSIINGPDRVFSDGGLSPNVMKHSALGLCNKKTQGDGWVVVLELRLERVETAYIEGAIKKPKGYTY
jgi:hypothetical protein